jgi:hypothetical protein
MSSASTSLVIDGRRRRVLIDVNDRQLTIVVAILMDERAPTIWQELEAVNYCLSRALLAALYRAGGAVVLNVEAGEGS